MHRLFVALRPPADVRAALLATMGGVADAHWQTDPQLHLTLAFIGAVDRHQADTLAAVLDDVSQPQFDARLGPWGSFDARRAGRIGTLWVAVGPGDPLTALAERVRGACRRAGVPVETRRFVPHITVARMSRGGVSPLELQRFLSVPPPPARWRIEAFWLVESRLGQGGAHYQPVLRYPLTGSSADRHRPSA